MAIQNFNLATITSISKILGDTGNGLTGSEIDRFLTECDIYNPHINSTKWKKLYDALKIKQESDRCANNIIAFIQHVMNPSRYFNNQEWFNNTRQQLNIAFAFEGLELDETGKFKKVNQIKTLSEAEERASNLKRHLLDRKIHCDVLAFCKAELLVDNYFHAVFEATKSIAEKIRNRTGLTSDGSDLVDEAFSFKGKIPHLALNRLTNESEHSEQKGFMNLLKGIFGTFRNTTAHAPKIKWIIDEQDALDILSTISLIHRKLDKSVEAKKISLGII